MAGNTDAIRKLNELVKEIRFAMLTTENSDGMLRSRPMVAQQVDSESCLWFFSGASSSKISEIRSHQQVNVSFAEPEDQRYVSISGTAETVRDRAKIEELWNPVYKAYFPNGPEDPDLCLLRVHITDAEYWDAPSSRMVQLAGFAKAIMTGERAHVGEHKKLDIA